jgi:tetratricopeptide (TPR) repeat protein
MRKARACGTRGKNKPLQPVSLMPKLTSVPFGKFALPELLFTIAIATAFAPSMAGAQLITMSKECRESVAGGNSMNADGNHQGALDLFSGIVEECDTRDGREAVQVGLATAYNGLGQYGDAVAAADLALEASKQESLGALHEKAVALEGQGDLQGAKSQFLAIIELTENNVDTAARANNYAKVADLEYRSDNRGTANEYLDKAIELDPENPAYNIQRSDWATNEGDAATAKAELDAAAAKGGSSPEMYAIRFESNMKAMQEKYGTDNVQALRSSMTAAETESICRDANGAIDNGLGNMQIEMFAALVCK